ncbi:MAG: DNA mismatch repair protein MutS, partial [Nitrospinae bacterium]|nr:DNA mismatch repair protein MutS [Nitrospinota bacterium]
SLLSVIDRCRTPMGKRNIREWIIRPLIDRENINRRLSIVTFFFNDVNLRRELFTLFKNIADIERISGRISLGNANAKDLIALRESLKTFPLILELLSQEKVGEVSHITDDWDSLIDMTELIERSIVDNPPFSIREGNIIQGSYNEELEELYSLTKDNQTWLRNFENRLKEENNITNLKVGYNKVYGFYIEVTKKNSHLVPENFIRRQSLVNCERFINDELKGYEDKILNAEERKKELEFNLFMEILSKIDSNRGRLILMAKKIGYLDTLLSFAVVAEENRYVEPVIKENNELLLEEGRHPVIEGNIEEMFVANSIELNDIDRRMAIITGPNMAGKSTYLRQTGLIVLMAQIGSYVPAKRAEVGIVDRIFTRVGAQDNLYRGQSTFMVEMNEAANILNNATKKSLVILDEIGRGTSTFDGLSIAWSIVEHLLTDKNLKCRTLFATHYHELTNIQALYKDVVNLLVKVEEYQDTITFSHVVAEGKADKSYGIHVAKLAGVPKAVVNRAEIILEEIENGNVDRYGLPKIDMRVVKKIKKNEALQTSLFDKPKKNKYKEIIQGLKELDINSLTPLEALNQLQMIKGKIRDKEEESPEP